MTAEARRTLRMIRECLAADRYALSVHFTERMAERGLFWPDVQAVIDAPHDMRSPGLDQYHRFKWIIRGAAATGEVIEIVCVVEVDDTQTEFITLYWED